MLSHQRIEGVFIGNPSSFNKVRIQRSYNVKLANVRYSDSVEDQDIAYCFLDDQEIKAFPK